MVHTEQETFRRSIRVADQLCSAHSMMCDKYRLMYMTTDIFCITISIWLVAMVFIQPEIAFEIYPQIIPYNIWIGILSIIICIITILHLIVDWKGKSQTHHSASIALSEFVKEFRPNKETNDSLVIKQALLKYQLITGYIEPIPETLFLKLKQRHLLKVVISKRLSTNPATNIYLYKVKIWLHDNCGYFKNLYTIKIDSKNDE